MTPMTLVTQISRPTGDGVVFPTGHLTDWSDLGPSDTDAQPVAVTCIAPTGEPAPAIHTIAYRLRDGDWLVPFVRVTAPGTIVRASTRLD